LIINNNQMIISNILLYISFELSIIIINEKIIEYIRISKIKVQFAKNNIEEYKK